MSAYQILLFNGTISLICIYTFLMMLSIPLILIAEKLKQRVHNKNFSNLEKGEEIVVAALNKLDKQTTQSIMGKPKTWKFALHYVAATFICFSMFYFNYFIAGVLLSLIPILTRMQFMKWRNTLNVIIPHLSKFNTTISPD